MSPSTKERGMSETIADSLAPSTASGFSVYACRSLGKTLVGRTSSVTFRGLIVRLDDCAFRAMGSPAGSLTRGHESDPGVNAAAPEAIAATQSTCIGINVHMADP